jgi:hypothetical protein
MVARWELQSHSRNGPTLLKTMAGPLIPTKGVVGEPISAE